MAFEPGTVVIHPAHGPMSVVSITNRKFPDGTMRDCLDLETLDTYALTVTVPVERHADVGLRDVVTGPELTELFDTLESATVDEPENWSRRYKANEEKVRSGSILKLAEVVRDILRRDAIKSVSLGERRTLEHGMSQLARELYYSKKMESVVAAEQLIREASLSGNSMPTD